MRNVWLTDFSGACTFDHRVRNASIDTVGERGAVMLVATAMHQSGRLHKRQAR